MILVLCPNPSVDTYWEIDNMVYGAVNRIQKQTKFPGGKGVHVALNIAELGEEVILLGIWGGNTGNWIKMECKKKHVHCDGVYTDMDTRTCISILSKNESINHTEFLEQGSKIDVTIYNYLYACFLEHLSAASLIVMSGSWPQGAGTDPYGLFIDEANKNSIPVWIDCAGEVLQNSLLHNPFGVHVNEAEALELLKNMQTDYSYILQHCKQLALTKGKKGLFLYGGEKMVNALYPLQQIISTVGCGDALLAGIVTASVRKLSFQEIANYGAACGAANCIRYDLGMFYKQDVDRFINSINE